MEEPVPEGTCGLDLDLRTGVHPPLYLQGDAFKYPERETTVAENTKHRFLYIGRNRVPHTKQYIKGSCLANGEDVTVMCHGLPEIPIHLVGLPSEDNTLTVATINCDNGVFKLNGAEVNMEAVDCSGNARHEPQVL